MQLVYLFFIFTFIGYTTGNSLISKMFFIIVILSESFTAFLRFPIESFKTIYQVAIAEAGAVTFWQVGRRVSEDVKARPGHATWCDKTFLHMTHRFVNLDKNI